MKSLSALLWVVGIAAIAVIYGCSGDSGSPTGPARSLGLAPTATAGDCGAADYLTSLSPVLSEWQDSLASAFGETFDDPPAFGENSNAEEYLTQLAPVLQQWEMTINTAADSAIVDTVPGFDPAVDKTPEYLVGLSDLLQQWKSAVDAWFERAVVPAPPVFAGDTEPPMIVCPPDTTVACADSSGLDVDFDGLIVVTDDCDPTPAISCEPPSGSRFLPGKTTVVCTAVDSVGNQSQCSFDITIAFAEPPVIACPADTTVECAGPDGTVVEFVVTASSECDTAVVVVCEPASGSAFPPGKSVVNCTATDSFGNVSECSFNVFVEDTEPPVIRSATPSHEYLWPPNHKMVEVSISVDVGDVCDSKIDCYIFDVTSNEDINGRGDGNTEPDWEITGDLTVDLRAERSGLGSGRTYYLHLRCEDDSGQYAEHVVEVHVPHDRGNDTATQ